MLSLVACSRVGNMDGGPPDGGVVDAGPCGMDCSKIATAHCTIAVCNTGQVLGPINSCVVVPSPSAACNDAGVRPDAGPCGRDCSAITTPPCTMAVCNTGQVLGALDTCVEVPLPDGTACDDGNPCTLDDACDNAVCVGQPNDCGASPLRECNKAVACNPRSGACEGQPDSSKDGNPCVESGDPCALGKTCMAGQCTGGTPNDCSFSGSSVRSAIATP